MLIYLSILVNHRSTEQLILEELALVLAAVLRFQRESGRQGVKPGAVKAQSGRGQKVMTTEELMNGIQRQNEIIISLLARLVWTPEKIGAIITSGKRNPAGYVTAYNALDGAKPGTQLAAIAGVTQPAMSTTLQAWLEEGIILNVGSDTVPKYKRLMRIPEAKEKGKRKTNGTNEQQ